jgi:hypothetical protein
MRSLLMPVIFAVTGWVATASSPSGAHIEQPPSAIFSDDNAASVSPPAPQATISLSGELDVFERAYISVNDGRRFQIRFKQAHVREYVHSYLGPEPRRIYCFTIDVKGTVQQGTDLIHQLFIASEVSRIEPITCSRPEFRR